MQEGRLDERDFVGTWRLVSWENRYADGAVTFPFGTDVEGYIMYSADRHVSVVIFAAHRRSFGTPDLLAGSDEDLVAAARTYISYVGTFEVRGERVVHRVAASLFPDWAGTAQERIYRFEGRRLELSTDRIPLGGREAIAALVWERVNAAS